MTTTWDRYVLKQMLKTFFLFLVCFYCLYIFIDYAHHTARFHQDQNSFSWLSFCMYYACEFSLRSEMLIPVAVLLGTLKTLCKLNQDNELIAMLASGISLKRLLKPLIFSGMFFTTILFINTEYVIPLASKHLKYIEDLRNSKKNNDSNALDVQSIPLENGAQLLFRKYDSAQDLFIDLYWVRSSNDLVKIEQLDVSTDPISGYSVTYLKRNTLGELTISKQLSKEQFPQLKLDEQSILEKIIPVETMSLSALWKETPENLKAGNEKEAKLLATFYRKMAFPWLCLLAVIAAIPSCVSFSRQFSPFMIYASSLFALIGIYLVIDSGHILGKRQILDPLTAIWAPAAIAFLCAYFRYWKLR